MSPAEPTKVFPVPGVFQPGEPHVEREVESKTEAERLVKTGAFALSRADAIEASPWSREAIQESEDAAAAAIAADLDPDKPNEQSAPPLGGIEATPEEPASAPAAPTQET